MEGLISAIQHCSVHDGPGIRTTVFLKGCNMRCLWCHNPETIYPKPEILLNPAKCIGCGLCEQGCYSGARELCGFNMTVEQVVADIKLDMPYYGMNGGATISGGEPFLQYDFLYELLLQCKAEGISCAIESNLSLHGDKLQSIAELCSLFICDIKLWDEGTHRHYTGIGNKTILENLKSLSQAGIPIIVRTPIIQGVNDTEASIEAIAEFISTLENISYYELLTYHPLGLSKPHSDHFKPTEFEKPTKQKMIQLAELAASKGLSVWLDGICHSRMNEKG